jgi:hypothetical protein
MAPAARYLHTSRCSSNSRRGRGYEGCRNWRRQAESWVDPAAFDIIAIKSRVHFCRGFDDTGFAKTILLVEPDEPFLGTTRLDGLTYETVDLKAYYPYGDVSF